MAVYNSECAVFDMIFTIGDTIDVLMTFTDDDDPTFTLVGKQLDIDVIDSSGTVLRSFSSAGTATIVVVTNTARIYSLTPFTVTGKYKFDIQMTTGSEVKTIAKGSVIVQNQVTT
jgi:nitrous oxide reductase